MNNHPTTKSADSMKVHGLSLLFQSSSYEVVYPAGSKASLNSIIGGAHVISSLKKKCQLGDSQSYLSVTAQYLKSHYALERLSLTLKFSVGAVSSGENLFILH